MTQLGGYPNSNWLVETSWLADHLDDPKVRILDSSVLAERQPEGGWKNASGLPNFDAGHIPGAQFVDLLNDWQAQGTATSHMLPGEAEFAAAAGALGISNDTRVIVYATAVPWWGTRLWWMFRAMGHDNVAVLNGGFKKWQAEGRPIETALRAVPPAEFKANRQDALIADKTAVQMALSNHDLPVVNALSRQLHTGESDLGYARPGRIAGSANLSALGFLSQEDGTYLPAETLAMAVAQVVDHEAEGAICYCGGGIAATMTAFVLSMLGYENVSVYDASLHEWAADPEMAMETG